MIHWKLTSKLSVLAALGLSAATLMAACGSSDASSGSSGAGGSKASGNTSGSDVGGSFLAGTTGSNGSAGTGVGGGCAVTSSKAQLLPLDMYIMLDKSGSMKDPVSGGGSKWDAVTGALSTFVNQPNLNGVSVGLQYFALPGSGGGDSCNAADYAMPAVEIATLPGAASAIIKSMNGHSPNGSTPTSAALDGAIQHATDWEKAHPTDVTIVVFATDGDPTECDTNLKHIEAIAAGGVNGMPKILTFVIGVGPSLQALDGIAMAGGTTTAFHVDTNGNAAQQFLDAMNKIRGSVLSCAFLIPKPAMGMIDFTLVNVQYTPGGGGSPVVVPNVKDKASCPASGLGWYYDNNAMPTQIILCDDTCNKVSADSKADIEILYGCTTQGPA